MFRGNVFEEHRAAHVIFLPCIQWHLVGYLLSLFIVAVYPKCFTPFALSEDEPLLEDDNILILLILIEEFAIKIHFALSKIYYDQGKTFHNFL